MPDTFEPWQFASHLAARWRFSAAVLAAALSAALAVSLLTTPEYTAHVSLVIEPLGGGDSRVSVAVSSVYLESLRTYEHLAAGDELFERAVEKFGLRQQMGGQPFEKVKRRALRVSIPRNTKVLDIAVTLPDARKAHKVALFLAEETMRLNRAANNPDDDAAIRRASLAAAQAEREYQTAETGLRRAQERPPTAAWLQADLTRLREQRAELDRMALSAALSSAEQEDRIHELTAAGEQREYEAAQVRSRLRSTRARAARLKQQIAELDSEWADKQKLLAERQAEADLQKERMQSMRVLAELEQRRLRDSQSAGDLRGERITVLDPGVVPERPVSPDLPLNLMGAAALGIVVALIWLSVEFALESRRPVAVRERPRALARS